MSFDGPLVRPLLAVLAVLGAVVGVVGGLALPLSGIVAVVLAGLVSGCLGAGLARESARGDRRAVADAAWRCAAVAVVALLVLSGTSVLGGAVLSLLVAGGAALGGLGWWLARERRADLEAARPTAVGHLDGPLPPVAGLPTEELGREWTRTTAALAGHLDVGTRQRLVARRQETLDEMERRDPDGFARWLAATPLPGSDPAGHLRDGDPA
ncbi:hypothetical protein ACI8AC_11730 [Geodermatophilus sp. SYSU D00758]